MSPSTPSSAQELAEDLWKVSFPGSRRRREGDIREGTKRRAQPLPFLPSFFFAVLWVRDITSEREILLAEVKNLKSRNTTLHNRVVFLEGEVERLTKEGRERGEGGEVRLAFLSSRFVLCGGVQSRYEADISALACLYFYSASRRLDLDPSLDFPLARRPSSPKPRSLPPRPRSSLPSSLDPQLQR